MNTNEISDIKKGTLQASALYKGQTKLWPLNSVTDGILYPENLTHLYTVSQYYKTDGNDLSVNSAGIWRDYITGTEKSMSYSHVTSADSATHPGVRFTKSNFSCPIASGNYGIYFRYRASQTGRGTTSPLKSFSNNYYGFEFYYENATISVKRFAGSSTCADTTLLSINPHDYHTYAIILNQSSELCLYVDGELTLKTENAEMPSNFVLYANISYNIASTIETLAVYNNYHTPEDVKAISDGISNKYSYEIIPAEKGLLLYDHGNQCDAVTNGWALNAYDTWAGTICVHGEEAIHLNGYNALSIKRYCSTQPYNLIDFTPYKKLYFLLSTSAFPSEVTYSCAVEGTKCGYTPTADHTSATGRVYTESPVSGIIGKIGQTEDCAGLVCMDISSVTGMYTPFIADGAGVGDGRCTRVYKVWLA